MANILYSLAQEGRGHASRSYEIIRRLAADGHRLIVLTGGDSYEPLEEAMAEMKNVSLRRLPGLRFSYDKKGKVDYIKTASKNLSVIVFGNIAVKKLAEMIQKNSINLVISDFEPFAPRAAKRTKTPFITIDNQHRIVFEKPAKGAISEKNALSYVVARGVVRSTHPLGKHCIIASVFKPHLRKKKFLKTSLHSVGPILRKEVEDMREHLTKEDFVLVYVKSQLEKAILPKLSGIRDKFVMYVKNPEKHRKMPNVIYRKHSATNFAQDLARCKAVISTAGEQLMSEALYLQKPMFLMSEDDQYEQKLNADCVKNHRVGDSMNITDVRKKDIERFLRNIHRYGKSIGRMKIKSGVNDVMKIINSELKKID